MKAFEIEARIGKDGPSAKINYNLGENIDELVAQFSPEIVYAHAKGSIVVAAQGKMRNLMDPEREGGAMSQEQIQAEMDKWKPSLRKPGKSQAERVRETFAKMDPETRKALLAQLAEGGDDVEEGEEEVVEETQAAGGRRRR